MGDLTIPRCLIGDFNDILEQEKKIGLHPKPASQIWVSNGPKPAILARLARQKRRVELRFQNRDNM
ncbi:hypothetical protein PIB30_065274 [Stylosanthes scabra]|uniref:Uncharacterized protein n=1 Tax=Stylosanthes scabra TaxID=79078 RepID=A0ABU6VLS4_9FABA|nr:hypothetical protein [Stylosanthes scabra]